MAFSSSANNASGPPTILETNFALLKVEVGSSSEMFPENQPRLLKI